MSCTTTTQTTPGRTMERHVETGVANTLLTASTPAGAARRLVAVTARYSGAPTQAGVTVTLNSGAGAAFDFELHPGVADAQQTIYVPTTPIPLMPDDVIDVACPAGGVGITCSVAIHTEAP